MTALPNTFSLAGPAQVLRYDGARSTAARKSVKYPVSRVLTNAATTMELSGPNQIAA